MASISAPRFPSHSSNIDRNPHEFISTNANPKFLACSSRFKKPSVSLPTFSSSSRVSDSGICRCRNQSDRPSSSDDFVNRRWDSLLSDVVKNAMKRWDEYMNAKWSSSKNCDSESAPEKEKEVGDWDWDRWKRHFDEVDEQESIASILKSQLHDAVHREDYKDAAKLKVAVAAATTNDTVGRAISILNRAIEEARYQDAAFIRDHAGAGLLGWWAGRSADSTDPYGRIIRITAEHGRYVARSYSSRQLATSTPGAPLFEIFFTMNDEGEYKHQAVYLRRNKGNSGDFLMKSSKPPKVSSMNSLSDSTEGKNDLSAKSTEDMEDSEERDDDADVAEGLTGIQNVLRDIIPGVKVKVLKVTAPEKVDRDLISKVIEQIMEEEDEEKDVELEDEEPEDEVEVELEDEVKAASDKGEIEMGAGGEVIDTREEQREMAVKVVIGGLVQKLPSDISPKDLLRVPARLERKDRFSFLFSIEKDDSQKEHGGKVQASLEKNSKLPGPRSINHVMSDLAKVLISREKIPMKVLKDVGELISLTLSQAQNRQPLSGSTIFSRITIPATSDPLNGLYIGAHGLYTSEVIYLRRKFGQWQEDGGSRESQNFEFYEYVEALKITGDPYIPAGQVAFRAKVGKQNQLPHKGIIPEEFGVVARYKGQGRLADPGFRNPRWVDGELVILDGKYIKGGPVVGFLYWAPEYHFLVFFNRLRLQD